MKVRVITALLITSCLIQTYSAKSGDNQQSGCKSRCKGDEKVVCAADDDHAYLYAPIIFCRGNLTKFFRHVFNDRAYARDVLPNDFCHFIQCLDYTQRRFDDYAHACHVVRLFTHKLRACTYVSAEAFDAMLDETAPIMRRYLEGARQKVLTAMKTSINDALYDAFLSKFSQFRQAPEDFLAELSDGIALAVYDERKLLGETTISDFITDVLLFFDLALGKLLWHPVQGIKTWHVTTSIADKLTHIAKHSVLSSDQLATLHDALFERYCFFLDVVGQDLPLSFFADLANDPHVQRSALLCAEPLEPCLETRKERFGYVLCQAEFKARAHEKGLVVRAS